MVLHKTGEFLSPPPDERAGVLFEVLVLALWLSLCVLVPAITGGILLLFPSPDPAAEETLHLRPRDEKPRIAQAAPSGASIVNYCAEDTKANTALRKIGTARILKVLEDSLPSTLNPLNARYLADSRVIELIHDAPFVMDNSGSIGASLVKMDKLGQPCFESDTTTRASAQGYLTSARFHNNQEVTVADLDSTLKAYADASTSQRLATDFYKELGATMEALADLPKRHFRVSYKNAMLDTRLGLVAKLLPRSAFTHPENSASWSTDGDFSRAAVGAGPFMVSKGAGIQAGASTLKLKAFAEYHKGSPKLDGIDIIAQPSAANKITEMKVGRGDVIVSLERENKAQLEHENNILIVPYYIRNWWYIGFNQNRKLPKSATFRKALALVINRLELAEQVAGSQIARTPVQASQAIDEKLLTTDIPADENTVVSDPSATLITGPFVPHSIFYNRTVPHLEMNHQEARRLLLTIPGISYDDKERRWMFEGAPLSLKFAYRVELPSAKDVATLLEQQLRDFGISLVVTPWTQAEWDVNTPSPKSASVKADLMMSRWNFETNDDIRAIFSSKGALNQYAYQNPAFDKIAREFSSAGYDDQVRMMRDAHKILAADLPCIFLWEAAQVAVFSKRVGGFRIHSFSFYINTHKWYLKDE